MKARELSMGVKHILKPRKETLIRAIAQTLGIANTTV